jgi:hypothetical protein
MIAASIDGLDPWATAEARRDDLYEVRRHLATMRTHESVARAVLGAYAHGSAELHWRSERIEGHALRAFVALMEWAST